MVCNILKINFVNKYAYINACTPNKRNKEFLTNEMPNCKGTYNTRNSRNNLYNIKSKNIKISSEPIKWIYEHITFEKDTSALCGSL